jgi:hypothetical protein
LVQLARQLSGKAEVIETQDSFFKEIHRNYAWRLDVGNQLTGMRSSAARDVRFDILSVDLDV